MKRLEISRLMDEYQDNEFFPNGGSAVDAQVVKDRVLTQATTSKKRRVPPLKAVLLAAVLTVGCALMIAAGIPGMAYSILSGTVTLEMRDGWKSIDVQFNNSPIKKEDGRLFLIQDGQRTDITDLIDEATPYIYDDSNHRAETYHYLIVGGTSDNYGWLEWFEAPQPSEWQRDERVIAAGMTDVHVAAYNAVSVVTGLNMNKCSGGSVYDIGLESQYYEHPWLVSALDELGILREKCEYEVAPLRPGIYFDDGT